MPERLSALIWYRENCLSTVRRLVYLGTIQDNSTTEAMADNEHVTFRQFLPDLWQPRLRFPTIRIHAEAFQHGQPPWLHALWIIGETYLWSHFAASPTTAKSNHVSSHHETKVFLWLVSLQWLRLTLCASHSCNLRLYICSRAHRSSKPCTIPRCPVVDETMTTNVISAVRTVIIEWFYRKVSKSAASVLIPNTVFCDPRAVLPAPAREDTSVLSDSKFSHPCGIRSSFRSVSD